MTLLSDKEIVTVFERFRKNNPEPKSELEYKDEYTLLVAVVLSAQATDKSVNKATCDLFKVADTPEKMVELGEKRLVEYIRSIGLYKNKVEPHYVAVFRPGRELKNAISDLPVDDESK